ncbi:glycoside hydrolase family 5 protein [Pedobacter mendelii]|uniref:Glycoside hydrolase family 5 domain-containing protein n=1 Tax=Pedobacter mendelii TaxID=1908240 RepID=A0ABQ2BII4_9SPHI|nr:glycoside hydrolase family 5 protein [Pedobacter mendelii]GGI25332.1 hypothetical protein GCM10008119_17130 [Pedobacter mendelii]
MRKFLFLSVCVLFYNISFAQNINWVNRNGALKVVGGKILNSKNIEPQLRGVSLSWSIWQGKKYYNEDVVNWLQSDFNINLLRVSMAVQPDGGYLQNPAEQEELITKTIDAAIKNGLYVLIDWHDHNAHQHLAQSKEFFIKMAKRYTGKPNVIYEIFNEPEKIEWQTVKDYAIAVIQEIRKYDSKNIIVVGSPHWDQDVDVAAKDPIKGFNNIAYSFHFYASEPSHQDVLMQKADMAVTLKLPLFVTEWGVGEASGDGKFIVANADKWVAWMEKNKLSSANWNITDKNETTALLKPGASVEGKWKLDMLTPAGLYIRTQLKKLNK